MGKKKVIDETYTVIYRSYTPEGTVWCEARDVMEMVTQNKLYDGEGQLVTKQYIYRHVTYKAKSRKVRI